jgi:hypothetical protein
MVLFRRVIALSDEEEEKGEICRLDVGHGKFLGAGSSRRGRNVCIWYGAGFSFFDTFVSLSFLSFISYSIFIDLPSRSIHDKSYEIDGN